MKLSKQGMLDTLPLCDGTHVVRSCSRHDLDGLAQWPKYPWPYEVFEFSFANLQQSQLDKLFHQRTCDPERITLVVDEGLATCIAYVAILRINWENGIAGDMSLRVRPEFCDRGIGSIVMRLVGQWGLQNGLKYLRLNVAASNARAIRCYENAGFRRQTEFWQMDKGLSASNLSESRYDFLQPHVRVVDEQVQVRFWWMQFPGV